MSDSKWDGGAPADLTRHALGGTQGNFESEIRDTNPSEPSLTGNLERSAKHYLYCICRTLYY